MNEEQPLTLFKQLKTFLKIGDMMHWMQLHSSVVVKMVFKLIYTRYPALSSSLISFQVLKVSYQEVSEKEQPQGLVAGCSQHQGEL